MRPIPLTFVALGLLNGCLSAPKMLPQVVPELEAAPALPESGEAVVAPLAFSAAEYKACLLVGAMSCKERLTLLHSAFLVRTGDHTLLIDAGLGADVQDWLALMPRWQQRSFEVSPTTHLSKELERFGVSDDDIEAVVLTHAHWDHAGGLSDLSHAQVLISSFEVDYVASIDEDVYRGTPPKLLSLDGIDARAFTFDGPAVGPFEASHDLFGDGTVLLLPLGGHTPGSTGVLLPNVGGRPVLFVGDLVWNRRGLELMSHKPRIATRSLGEDLDAVSLGLHQVQSWAKADPKLLVVPSHDILAWKELEETSGKWTLR